MIEHSAKLKEWIPKRSLQRLTVSLAPAAAQVKFFALSALLAAAPVAGGAAPFALALSAAVPQGFALAAGAGAVTGYAAGLPLLTAARYLTAVCMIAMVRWLLQGYRYSRMAAAAAGGISLITVQIILDYLMQMHRFPLKGFGELLMIASMTWLFLRLPIRMEWEELKKPEKQAAVLVLLWGVLGGLASFQFFGISVSLTIGLLLILLGGYLSGARTAILAAAAVMGAAILAEIQPETAFAVVLSGLAAVLFAESRKMMTAVCCGTALLGICIMPSASQGAGYVGVCFLAGALLLLLPAGLFSAAVKKEKGESGFEESTAHRLGKLSGALREVQGLVDDICKVSQKKKTVEPIGAEYVCDTICSHCDKNIFCWVDHYSETIDVLQKAEKIQKKTGYLPIQAFPSYFQTRCQHLPQVCGALTKNRAICLASAASETRTQLLRTALNEQYSAVADSLEHLAGEVLHQERQLPAKGKKVAALFREMQLPALKTEVTKDEKGRVQAQVTIPRVVLNEEEKKAMETEVSVCCDCTLKLSSCEAQGDTTVLLFLEKALLKPSYARAGSAAKENVSADVTEYFCDENGFAHLLLCDGMGTGRSAAIDGKMAAVLMRKLLLAGFSCNAAARLVNVALQLRGSEEGGAALDACSVDLYTGQAAFFKAGAAPTFLLRNQRVEMLSCDSLPIGTAGETEGVLTELAVRGGDVLVMLSDGVSAIGEAAVKERLARLAGEPAEKMAEELAAFARQKSRAPDDITVSVLELQAV